MMDIQDEYLFEIDEQKKLIEIREDGIEPYENMMFADIADQCNQFNYYFLLYSIINLYLIFI